MSRNFRVRTEVGKEKKLTFEIKQDIKSFFNSKRHLY